MKQLTITITALVTDSAIDEEINPIIQDDGNTFVEEGDLFCHTTGRTALRLADKLDNKYAEIQHAEFSITDAKIEAVK